MVQRRLNNPCCDEIRRTYGGNQAANNQQQKIGAGHVGESRSKQAERENLVKNNVGSRAKRVSSAPSETPTFLQTSTFLQKPAPLQKASVEQIWSSWRHEKQAPKSADAAERLNQLKRIGEYETALQVALAEVRLEEQGRPQDWRARNGPLVLLGSGHDLSEAEAIR